MRLDMTRSAERLAALRDAACAEIDAAAEAARARYITLGAGQAMTYQAKGVEAADVLAGGSGAHPLLEAEASATGVSVADLAASVAAMSQAWTLAAAAIEGARLGGKASVRSAANPPAIEAAKVAALDALKAI